MLFGMGNDDVVLMVMSYLPTWRLAIILLLMWKKEIVKGKKFG
jgi:hypothetical protein